MYEINIYASNYFSENEQNYESSKTPPGLSLTW